MVVSIFTTPSVTDSATFRRLLMRAPINRAGQQQGRRGTGDPRWCASSDHDGSIVSHEWREGSTSIGIGATIDVWLPLGVHTLTLEVTDDDGAIDTDTMVVTVSPANQVTVTASTPQATEAGPVAASSPSHVLAIQPHR